MDDVTQYVLPTYETLLLSIDGGGPVATVTLNRPDVLNALNAQLFHDLETVFTLLTANAAVRAIVITGAGPKAFAAGADIAEMSQTDAGSGEQLALRGQAVFRKIETCGKPVIAAVNGFALGGGCELAWRVHCALRPMRRAWGSRRSSWASSRATAERNACRDWLAGPLL